MSADNNTCSSTGGITSPVYYFAGISLLGRNSLMQWPPYAGIIAVIAFFSDNTGGASRSMPFSKHVFYIWHMYVYHAL